MNIILVSAYDWSEDELQQLNELYDEGMDAEDIAEEMGIPVGAVRAKLLRARGGANYKFNWTKERLKDLKDMYKAGIKLKAIAEEFDTSVNEVRDKILELRSRNKIPLRNRRWTGGMEARLLEMQETGESMRKMAAEFDMTPKQISQKLANIKKYGRNTGRTRWGTKRLSYS